MGVKAIQPKSVVFADHGAMRARHTVRLAGAPSLGDTAGMGLEALAALLSSQVARENAKLARDMQRDSKESQAQAIQDQVAALREKASDMTSEALVAGTVTAAGGVLTVASVFALPSPSDASRSAQWDNAAKRSGGGFAVVSKQCDAALEVKKATATATASIGSSLVSVAGPIAKGTYGAQQALDDAEATQAAANAKFAETSRDEWAAIAREFDSGSGKALQILQAMVTERQQVRRGILQRM